MTNQTDLERTKLMVLTNLNRKLAVNDDKLAELEHAINALNHNTELLKNAFHLLAQDVIELQGIVGPLVEKAETTRGPKYKCDWCGKAVDKEELFCEDYDSETGICGSMICQGCKETLYREEQALFGEQQ